MEPTIDKKLFEGPFDFIEKKDHSVIPSIISAKAISVHSVGPSPEINDTWCYILSDAADPSASDVVFAVLISRFAFDNQTRRAELIATNGDIYYTRRDYFMPPLTTIDRDVIRNAIAEFETE